MDNKIERHQFKFVSLPVIFAVAWNNFLLRWAATLNCMSIIK